MRQHAVVHQRVAFAGPRAGTSQRVFRYVTDRFLLLPLGAIIALAWANIAPDSYFRFAHAAAFPVNEIAMAFFLALITQELWEALVRAAHCTRGAGGRCRCSPRPAAWPVRSRSTLRMSA